MQTSFTRQTQLSLKSAGPDENHRAHFFLVNWSLQGVPDPDSGMVLNLVEVDERLRLLSDEFHGITLEYFEGNWEWPLLLKEVAELMLEALAKDLPKGVTTSSLELIEVRGGEHLTWEKDSWIFWTRHYLENIEGAGSVWELRLGWKYDEPEGASWEKVDLNRQARLLLKNSLRKQWTVDQVMELRHQVGSELPQLIEISIENKVNGLRWMDRWTE